MGYRYLFTTDFVDVMFSHEPYIARGVGDVNVDAVLQQVGLPMNFLRIRQRHRPDFVGVYNGSNCVHGAKSVVYGCLVAWRS